MLEMALNKENQTNTNQLYHQANKREQERKKAEGMILASSEAEENTVKKKKPNKNLLKNEIYGLQDQYLYQLDQEYSFLHNEKKAKKFMILRSIKML